MKIRFSKEAVVVIAALGMLTACGGPETESGVRYDAKTASDVQDACRAMLEANLKVSSFAGAPDKIKKSSINTCCKASRKAASDLDPKQRTFLWNQWMAFDTIGQTANQVKSFREIEDALGDDLIYADRMEAVVIRTTAAKCVGQEIKDRL